MSRVLVVDDDPLIRKTVVRSLARRGHAVVEASEGDSALRALGIGVDDAGVDDQNDDDSVPAVQNTNRARGAAVSAHNDGGTSFDVVLLDLQMPGPHGLEVLRTIRAMLGAPPVIVMTALTDVGVAVEAERLGAVRFILKPLDLAELPLVVERAIEGALREDELSLHRSRSTYHDIVGGSAAMTSLFHALASLESVDVSVVLVTGESGTGKDLVARAIHARGRRKSGPFVEVDCAALPEALLESTLFGHERGAFTDAKVTKRGLFEVAGAGTVFLDEIGEMPLGSQAKLLRALENRRFKRLGGLTDIDFDATVVAATNRDLRQQVGRGAFREDLYYRLNVFPIAVPPLRERLDDVPLLATHFISRLAPRLGRQSVALPAATRAALSAYAWPGNVRELRNVMERALILTRGDTLELSVLPSEIQASPTRAAQIEARLGAAAEDAQPRARVSSPDSTPQVSPPKDTRTGSPTPVHADPIGSRSHGATPRIAFVLPSEGIDLDELERDLLRQALARSNGNQTQAARLLGISRHALAYRQKQLKG